MTAGTKLLAWLRLAAVVLAAGGCSVTIGTRPDAYPFPSDQIFDVEPGVTLEVVNGYTASERVTLASNVYCDLRHFTDTAVGIVQRELGKKGVTIGPNAEKRVVLRIVDPVWTLGTWTMKGKVTLQAQFGATTVSVDGQAQTGGNAPRVFNASILRSVIALLKNAELQAYLNER